MKTRLFLAGIGMGIALCPVQVAAEDAKSWLLMEVAENATLENGQLVLTGIDDQITLFTDRPYRDAMNMSVESIVENWGHGENSFASDPPNAALSGMSAGKQVGMIVTLSNPKLENDALTFDYEALHGTDVTQLESVSLVVDSIYYTFQCWASWGEDCNN